MAQSVPQKLELTIQAKDSTPKPQPSRWERLRLLVIKNFLPLAFLVSLAAALAWPVPGRFLAQLTVLGNVRIMQVLPMALVFLFTGLQLDTKEMKRALALHNLPSVLYGFAAILLITPCLGFAMREIPLQPREFAIGLTVFCVAPTTLGVGVALTTACGGNEAVALLLTVGTNALAVLTMPPELQLLLNGVSVPSSSSPAVSSPSSTAAALEAGAPATSQYAPPQPAPGDGSEKMNVSVNVTDLLIKLAITVLVPFIIGKAMRELWPAVQAFVRARRVPISLLSTSCLAFVVWQTLSAARDLLLAQSASSVLAMIGLALGMHVVYLVFNYLIVWHLLRPPIREAVAVVIMASQKSAPVAVTVIAYLAAAPEQQGLLALPAVVGQLGQIFMGAALAHWLAGVVKRSGAAPKDGKALPRQADAAAAVAIGVAVPGTGTAAAAAVEGRRSAAGGGVAAWRSRCPCWRSAAEGGNSDQALPGSAVGEESAGAAAVAKVPASGVGDGGSCAGRRTEGGGAEQWEASTCGLAEVSGKVSAAVMTVGQLGWVAPDPLVGGSRGGDGGLVVAAEQGRGSDGHGVLASSAEGSREVAPAPAVLELALKTDLST